MRIQIIAVGQKMPSWVNDGYHEYAKRLGPEMPLELVEIPAGKRGKNANIEKLISAEGKASIKAAGKNDFIVALDVKGKRLSTQQMAQELTRFQHQGRDLSIFIGGPEGLAPDCIKIAHYNWSLSDLTLPHPLVRVLLAEQIYRCGSLLKGHPYHK